MNKTQFVPTPEMTKLLMLSGSPRREVAMAANYELAKALEVPMRSGILYGDILDGVFQKENFQRGQTIDYPLNFLQPGTEKNFVSYTIPNHGYIPQRHVEGDVISVSTYRIANAIDTTLQYAELARWPVVEEMIRVFRAGFTKKLNDDGFHTLLAAAIDRNIVVYDSYAAPGTFTKRLISLLEQVMRRNQGGNSTSVGRGRLTDLFMSPEALQDVRNWSIADIDEVTRRDIFNSPAGALSRIFNVNLHDIDELGDGQQYQNFYLNDLGGSLAAGDEELVLGLDLSNTFGTFMMPVKQELQMFADDNLHREQRMGFYGWQEQGFMVADSRKLVLGSL